jgi:maleylacetoacetate isomerase
MQPERDAILLYDYWRSSAAYRVRIALNLKRLDYTQVPVNLAPGASEQHGGSYREINPQGLVPALIHEGRTVTQSLAICAYLDQVFPEPALLPADPAGRARVNAMALVVACDIHPINNLRVQRYLKSELAAREGDVVTWMNHWMTEGFLAFEQMLQGGSATGLCCHGDEPGLADCCLIPQVYNAERFGCDMARFPTVVRIVAYCRALPAFAAAAPERQGDAPANGDAGRA